MSAAALALERAEPRQSWLGFLRAELARGSGDPGALRPGAWQSIGEADRLAELSAFEPEGAERGERVRGLIDPARRVLLVQAALAQEHASEQPAAIDDRTHAARSTFGKSVAGALADVANRLDTGAAISTVDDVRSPLAVFGASGRRDGEVALCEELVDRVEALQRAAEVA